MGVVSLILSHLTPHYPARWKAWLHHSRFVSRTSGAQEGGGICPGHLWNSGPAKLCSPGPDFGALGPQYFVTLLPT